MVKQTSLGIPSYNITCSEIVGNNYLDTCQTYLQLRRNQNNPSCGELSFIFLFLSVIIMSSILIHSWLFKSDKVKV